MTVFKYNTTWYLMEVCNNYLRSPILMHHILLLAANCASVTPLPMADVDETPPVTVLMRLSA
jgi:hypothetical protein